MANALYPRTKPTLLGAINLLTDTLRAQLVDIGAYGYAVGHQFLSSVPAAARIGTPGTLAGRTLTTVGTKAVFDADDTLLTAVPAGTGTAAQSEAIVIYRDTGDAATSDLIAFLDTGTGLPLVTNGGNAVITWDAAGIFTVD